MTHNGVCRHNISSVHLHPHCRPPSQRPSTHCCEKPPFHSGRWPNFRSDSFKLQIRNPCLRQSSNLNNKLRQRRCVCVGHSGNYEHFAQHKQRNKTPSCWWSDGEQSHVEKLIVCCTRIIRKFKSFLESKHGCKGKHLWCSFCCEILSSSEFDASDLNKMRSSISRSGVTVGDYMTESEFSLHGSSFTTLRETHSMDPVLWVATL